MSICVGHLFNQLTCILRLEGRSIPYPLLLVFFLQNGWTATLTAAYKGHLTVLETLVEQYGGNVLHRMKVKCYGGWCFDELMLFSFKQLIALCMCPEMVNCVVQCFLLLMRKQLIFHINY